MDSIRCKQCPAAFFQRKKSLYKHMRKFHDEEHTSVEEKKIDKLPKKSDNQQADCFPETQSASVATEHNYASSSRKRTSRLKCPYDNCFEVFSYNATLRLHLFSDHSIKIEEENLTFNSMEDFQKWKDEMQQTTSSFYSLDTSTKYLSSNNTKQFFNCHRSYCYKPKGKNIRSLKSTGSNKIGKACPSRIEVLVNEGGTEVVTKSIEVKFWKTHHGHSLQLGHTYLGKETRMQLAGKLQQGVTFQHIIDEIRDSNLKEEGLQRSHLLDKKDLHNIVRDFNLSYTTKKHSDDAVSVHLWVKEMQELGDTCPVLNYKSQNEHDDCGILNQCDFLLVLMTNFQGQQLQKFGHDKVCIDGTHGTNAYDIQLFTLLVVDEYGAGCPVAFCFSNRCDETLFKVFFQSVKDRVGDIKSNIFMSDDAPAFYNAWSVVMSKVQHRLLCSWHIDRNWKQNLNKIADVEKRAIVYKTLKVLLQIDSVDKFDNALSTVLTDLFSDVDTKSFGQYFQNFYCQRTEMWAYCFRQHLGINTNMYLESVHKTLKYYYLEGKKTRRLDKTVHAVMKLARDSLFNRIIKISKNTSTSRIRTINVSHSSSRCIAPSMITSLEQNEWLVKSSAVSDQEYIVQKVRDSCIIPNCSLKCDKCDICVHFYKCSCMDSVIKFNICKHIHAVSFHFQNNSISVHPNNKMEHVSSTQELVVNIIPTVNKNTLDQNNSLIKKKIDIISGLHGKANLCSEDQAQVLKQLDKVIDIMNKGQITFSNESIVNTNQKIDKQIRLFSTKKKKTPSSNNLNKPSVFEERNINDSFFGKAKPMVFNSSDDHTYL